MRFYEFATNKPKKPRKPLTPAQSMVAARARQVKNAKQALQKTKDHQKRREDLEQTRRAWTAALGQQFDEANDA